jgi:hypothetical protein
LFCCSVMKYSLIVCLINMWTYFIFVLLFSDHVLMLL